MIVHKDDLQPCLLNEALFDADIFLTTHGFQSTGVLFMKEGSVLFEAFPYKYWKEGYMHLAWEFGLHHRWTQMEEAVSWDRYLRRCFDVVHTCNQWLVVSQLCCCGVGLIRKLILTLLPQSTCMKNLHCR